MIIIFYILTFLEISFIFFYIRKKAKSGEKKRLILLEPFSFFSICWLVLYNLVPILMVANNNYYYEEGYSTFSIVYSKFLLTVFYFFTYVFFLVVKNSFKTPKILIGITQKKLNFPEKFLLYLYFFFTVAVSIAYINHIFRFGVGNYFQNRIVINKGLGFITLIIYSSNILALALFINMFISKSKSFVSLLKKVVIYSSILLFATIYLLIGSRLSVLLLVIQILFVYIYLKKKINRKFVVRTGAILFTLVLALSFFGFFRVRIKHKGKNLYAEFAKVFVEKISYNIVANFGKYENMVWMNDNLDGWNSLYGKTFLAGFTNVVPRKIWKNKPLGGGPELRNWIKPGSYNLESKNARNITSYTTGLPTEAYMNFNVFGIVLIPFFLAFFLALLNKMLAGLDGNILQLSIYIYLLISLAFVFQYGEFLGMFSRTLFSCAPFLVIKFFGRFKYVLKR